MDAVSVEIVRPHVALVTINRPEARNAVNSAVASALDAAVKSIEQDHDIWAAVLTGAGGVAFCAGGCAPGTAVTQPTHDVPLGQCCKAPCS